MRMDSDYELFTGDCLEVMRQLEADSVDLCFFSPPYEDARTYGIDFNLKGQAWVDWMVQVFRELSRICKGLIACVCQGKTDDFRWSAAPILLGADLHRAGFNLRTWPLFRRIGIPGSGGPDWWRNDYEFIICVTRPGKLPWSDNTATGHPPKWAPGGEMSHRLSDGTRRNQWGGGGEGKTDSMTGARDKDGKRRARGRPSHKIVEARLGRGMANGVPGNTKGSCRGRRIPAGHTLDGEILTEDVYLPPVLANPGNVVERTYTVEEVADLLKHYERGDVLDLIVGGGVMGSPLAHLSEAPFPEKLVEPFVLSFCPAGGLVLDPMCGSGTTGAVAIRYGRKFLGIDVRESQIELTRKRLENETPMMFA